MTIYNFFDEIVCINLDISKDRKKHAEYYFKKYDIPAKFFITSKHKNGGMYGCFDSHIQILTYAYQNDLNNILIFEDDFLPTSSYTEDKMEKAISFMKTNNDWDIFYLGYSFIKDGFGGINTVFDAELYNDDIIQYNPFCTQAVCYNKKSIKKIIETYKDYIGLMHYDIYLSSYIGLKNYCIIPMLFDQNFYFQHNNQSMDNIEGMIRAFFPIIAFTKFNYRMTVLRYYQNDLYFFKKYMYLIIIIYILHIAKTYISNCNTCHLTYSKNQKSS